MTPRVIRRYFLGPGGGTDLLGELLGLQEGLGLGLGHEAGLLVRGNGCDGAAELLAVPGQFIVLLKHTTRREGQSFFRQPTFLLPLEVRKI